MKHYVLVFCGRQTSAEYEVLTILKNRPNHLKGRLNLPGGKVEPNEYLIETAKRELFEESGLVAESVDLLGSIHGGWVWNESLGVSEQVAIHCFKAQLGPHMELAPRPEETEPVSWMPISDVLKDKRSMKNLRIVLPLMQHDIKGWSIKEVMDASPDVDEYIVDLSPQ